MATFMRVNSQTANHTEMAHTLGNRVKVIKENFPRVSDMETGFLRTKMAMYTKDSLKNNSLWASAK